MGRLKDFMDESIYEQDCGICRWAFQSCWRRDVLGEDKNNCGYYIGASPEDIVKSDKPLMNTPYGVFDLSSPEEDCE